MTCNCKPQQIAPISTCTHRGELIRRELCQTCTGRVWKKIYACNLGGECTAATAAECQR